MTKDYYSEIAPGYDELHGEEQDRKLVSFLERVTIPDAATVLDVGCGTGRSIRLLNGHWHGVEPAEGLIEHAHPEAKPRIVKGVAEDLPFPDASFDVVLSLTVLQNVEDPAKALAEMKRVCKPSGIMLISYLNVAASRLDVLVRELFSVQEEWERKPDRMFICRA